MLCSAAASYSPGNGASSRAAQAAEQQDAALAALQSAVIRLPLSPDEQRWLCCGQGGFPFTWHPHPESLHTGLWCSLRERVLLFPAASLPINGTRFQCLHFL